jgi:hypothetical protein
MFALVTQQVLNLLISPKKMAISVPEVSTALRARTLLKLVPEVPLDQTLGNRKPPNASSARPAHMVTTLVLLLASHVVAPPVPRPAQRVASVLA